MSLFEEKLETQKKFSLNQIQMPFPPFKNIGIDLLDPIMVKSMVKKKALIKV